MGKKVILAGGSGLIGRSLARVLGARGTEVVMLSRHPRTQSAAREVLWDGETAGSWAAELEGAAAVVNFAGRSINCVHTPQHRQEILESRVNAVQALGLGYARTKNPPPLWVQCSAAGIYGNAGDRFCDEGAPPGADFLAEVCRRWEKAFQELELPQLRRVVLRLGVVLDRQAGIFPSLAKLTRLFMGGTAGSGRQYVSWIHREDIVRVLTTAMDDAGMSGVYNACAPDAVTNKELMRELRALLGRPWAPPAPEFAVRFGAKYFMKTEADLILHGQRCVPQRLVDAGFPFDFPQLKLALADLGKKTP